MRTCFTVLVIVSLLLWIAVGGAASDREAAVFDPVREIGNTRVTLLEFSQIRSFSAQQRNSAPANAAGTPGVEVVYLVEQLGGGDELLLNVGGAKLFVDGERVDVDAGVIAGGVGRVEPYPSQTQLHGFDVPAVASPGRARVCRDYLRGVSTSSDFVELRIEVGFGKLESFVFEGLPAAVCGGSK